MTAPELLLRLYPRAFRDRWGPDVLADVEGEGWRVAPDLAIGAAGQWLHPVLWPASRPEQRLRRAAAVVAAATLTTWLLAYVAIDRRDVAPSGITGSHSLDLCAWVMLTGLALLVPLPRFSPHALLAIVRRTAARLGAPVGLGAIVATSIEYVGDPIATRLRGVLLCMWWIALMSAAAQAPRILSDLGQDTSIAAGPVRLRVAIWLLVAANLVSAVILLSRAVESGYDPLLTASALGIAVLAAAYMTTNQDLRAVATHSAD